MKQIGNYNKLPKDFKNPRLENGQTATYRLNDEFSRVDPLTKKVTWPYLMKIPMIDSIMVEEGGEQKIVDIGLVSRVDREGNPTVEHYWLQANGLGGEFTLYGDSMEDQKRFWVCELTNRNGTKVGRDKGTPILFYRVNHEAEANAKVSRTELRLECLILIKNSSEKDIRKLAAAFNWNDKEIESVLRNKLNEFAERDPKMFSALATSKDVETKATIKRAKDKGVINYNAQGHKVVWATDNSTIATLKRVEGKNWLDQFSDWIKTHNNGKATYENIEKLLDGAEATS